MKIQNKHWLKYILCCDYQDKTIVNILQHTVINTKLKILNFMKITINVGEVDTQYRA